MTEERRNEDVKASVDYREAVNGSVWHGIRLDIKYDDKGDRKPVHTLNSTAVATIFGEPHADAGELLAWVGRLPRVGRIYCVHGEEADSRAFAASLTAHGHAADVPARGAQIEVGAG